MSQIFSLSLPDAVYNVIEKKAKEKQVKITEYIVDCAMMDCTGKTRLQFMREYKQCLDACKNKLVNNGN